MKPFARRSRRPWTAILVAATALACTGAAETSGSAAGGAPGARNVVPPPLPPGPLTAAGEHAPAQRIDPMWEYAAPPPTGTLSTDLVHVFDAVVDGAGNVYWRDCYAACALVSNSRDGTLRFRKGADERDDVAGEEHYLGAGGPS
jgi:hypothetical protein